MLLFTRKVDETVYGVIDKAGLQALLDQASESDGSITLFTVKLVRLNANRARLGFESPAVISIQRDDCGTIAASRVAAAR